MKRVVIHANVIHYKQTESREVVIPTNDLPSFIMLPRFWRLFLEVFSTQTGTVRMTGYATDRIPAHSISYDTIRFANFMCSQGALNN